MLDEIRFFFAVVLFSALVLAIITLNPLGIGTAILTGLGSLATAFLQSPLFVIVIISVGIALLVGSIFR